MPCAQHSNWLRKIPNRFDDDEKQRKREREERKKIGIAIFLVFIMTDWDWFDSSRSGTIAGRKNEIKQWVSVHAVPTNYDMIGQSPAGKIRIAAVEYFVKTESRLNPNMNWMIENGWNEMRWMVDDDDDDIERAKRKEKKKPLAEQNIPRELLSNRDLWS